MGLAAGCGDFGRQGLHLGDVAGPAREAGDVAFCRESPGDGRP